MKRLILLFAIITLAGNTDLKAQSFAFGFKGGPILGIQQWNSFDRDPLFKYHGMAFIESYDENNESVSLFLQGGYHIRGSAIRNSRFTNNNQIYNLPVTEYIFRNVALSLGAKKKQELSDKSQWYYLLGIRGEYNINTNFNEFDSFGSIFYPNDFYVRKFVGGAIFGAGMEFMLGELTGGLLELTINPDITRQYFQPPIGNVVAPWDPSITLNVSERNIRNITVELTFGIRFLRIVEYVD
ncbi:MAG: hypothetical protein GYB31_13620 [Bacteroidetes bacterium]|nr:hypothetical protein [Bacteroidota bacterium]